MNLLRKYWIFLTLFFPSLLFGQVEKTESNYTAESELGVGGDCEDEIDESALFLEKTVNMELWDINDSLRNIPAYDTYCHFDTRNLFLHKEAKEYVVDTVEFNLCYESCDFAYPFDGALTSGFGPRWGRMHYGIDIDLETGDPVKAAFEGMVRISQYHPSYGNVIVIRHNNGLETLYAHLSKRDLAPGDFVQAGDIIGLGGTTGRSTGPHLHFEVRYMGEPIDPSTMVDPASMKLRDWEFALTIAHFDYAKTDAAKATGAKKTKKYHTVKSGETLSGIAVKRHTTVTTLCKANRISRNSILRVGQKLAYY